MMKNQPIDHKAFLRTLSRESRQRLTQKSDLAGLRHLAQHLLLTAVLAVLIMARVPLWWVLLLPQGVLLVFLFTLQHEATHKTPFASNAANEFVGFLTGVVIVQPFYWFRYFHLAHHRYTNDPENDPELVGNKPTDWQGLVWHLGTLGYWKDKLMVLWHNATGELNEPWLPRNVHSKVCLEARVMIAIYVLLLVFTVTVSAVLLWIWLLPLILGFPFLRLYLLAEHGRCPTVANMFLNTRTTLTNSAIRFIAWNMPYHVEHHVFPTVPFHRLPEFHEQIQKYSHTITPGYVRFARDYAENMTHRVD